MSSLGRNVSFPWVFFCEGNKNEVDLKYFKSTSISLLLLAEVVMRIIPQWFLLAALQLVGDSILVL